MIFKRAYDVILRNLGLIILVTFICAVAAGIISLLIPVDYVTESQLMVVTYDNNSEKVLDEYMVSQELAKTFAQIAQTSSILNMVNEQLGTNYQLNVFEKGTIAVKNTSGIITITVTDKDPDRAQKVADAMARALVKYVKESLFTGMDLIKVINNAYEPQKPGLMFYLINAVKGGIGGAALIIVIVLALDLIKSPVKSSKEIKNFLELNTLGKIKYNKNLSSIDKNNYKAEEFDFLRVNLRNNSEPGKDRIFAVVSPGNREGKTTICVNLAANISSDENKVLLIDCNFSKQDLSKMFGCENQKGLNTYGREIHDYNEIVRPTSVDNLYIIPAGEKSSGPITGNRLSGLLENVKNDFDYIIIDTPSALIQADASDYLYYTDMAVIVAEYDKTSVHKIGKVCDMVRMSGSRVAGVVINKAKN